MKIKAFFISDLHIDRITSDDEREKQEIILRFLNLVESEATHLFIVGDLFDFWYEYKYVIQKEYFPFLVKLRELTNKGIKVHYLAGNHDFALGKFFPKYLDVEIHLNEEIFELGGKRFYLFHGDGIAKKDVGYRILKKILRSKANQKLFRLLHPDFGIPFARFVSGSSRKYTNQMNHLRDESDYIEFAGKKFEEGFDYILMGHRHNPLEHKNGDKKYINLGDWITLFSYAEFDGEDLQLKYYK